MGRKSVAEGGCGFQSFLSLSPKSASASTGYMLGCRALPHTCSAEAMKRWLAHPPGDAGEWAVRGLGGGHVPHHLASVGNRREQKLDRCLGFTGGGECGETSSLLSSATKGAELLG